MFVSPDIAQKVTDLILPILRGQGKRCRAHSAEILEGLNEVLSMILDRLRHRDLTDEQLEHYVRCSASWDARDFFARQRREALGCVYWDPAKLDTKCARKSDNPIEASIQAESVEQMHRAISQLPPEEQDALTTWAEGRPRDGSFNVMAQRWNIPAKRVYYLKDKALATLRARLGVTERGAI